MIAVVQQQSNENGTSVASYTIPITSTGAGHLLVVIVFTSGSIIEHVTQVDDGTTNFSHFGERSGTDGANIDTFDTWYLLSSNSGKTAITITYGVSNGSFKSAAMWEVSGFTTPATDGENGAIITQAVGGDINASSGVTLATTGATGFLCAMAAPNNSIVQNPKTGNAFTAGGQILDGIGSVSLISAAASTYRPVWTGDTDGQNVTVELAAFKETAAAAAQVPYNNYMVRVLTQ